MMQEEFSVALRIKGNYSKGDIVEVQCKIKHPSRTGLQLVETATTPYERFVRNQAAEYVRSVEVLYDGEQVSLFEFNSSTADNPFISFMLRVDKEAPLKVVVTNHLRETAETSEDLVFA